MRVNLIIGNISLKNEQNKLNLLLLLVYVILLEGSYVKDQRNFPINIIILYLNHFKFYLIKFQVIVYLVDIPGGSKLVRHYSYYS